MMMKINMEMNNNRVTKIKEWKNKNTITHKDNREITTNQVNSQKIEVVEPGTKKDKENKKQRVTQKEVEWK